MGIFEEKYKGDGRNFLDRANKNKTYIVKISSALLDDSKYGKQIQLIYENEFGEKAYEWIRAGSRYMWAWFDFLNENCGFETDPGKSDEEIIIDAIHFLDGKKVRIAKRKWTDFQNEKARWYPIEILGDDENIEELDEQPQEEIKEEKVDNRGEEIFMQFSKKHQELYMQKAKEQGQSVRDAIRASIIRAYKPTLNLTDEDIEKVLDYIYSII